MQKGKTLKLHYCILKTKKHPNLHSIYTTFKTSQAFHNNTINLQKRSAEARSHPKKAVRPPEDNSLIGERLRT